MISRGNRADHPRAFASTCISFGTLCLPLPKDQALTALPRGHGTCPPSSRERPPPRATRLLPSSRSGVRSLVTPPGRVPEHGRLKPRSAPSPGPPVLGPPRGSADPEGRLGPVRPLTSGLSLLERQCHRKQFFAYSPCPQNLGRCPPAPRAGMKQTRWINNYACSRAGAQVSGPTAVRAKAQHHWEPL